MKYSKTAITQLTRWYKSVLTKCAILNAVVFASMALATPAGAETYTERQTNLATVENGVFENIDSTNQNGGAIYNTVETSISGSTFKGNTAKYGSAVYLDKANATIDGTFENNKGSGTVYVKYANASITGTFKNNNGSTYGGGAIYSAGSTNTINEITVGGEYTGNSTGLNGGAIYASSTKLTIADGTTFTNNKSGVSNSSSAGGGAISISAKPSSLIIGNNVTFDGNTAGYTSDGAVATAPTIKDGGAINLGANMSNTPVFGSNVQFKNNKATGTGGAIHSKTNELVVNNGVAFANNEATQGGAIALAGNRKVQIGDSTFTGNKAVGESAIGGAIVVSGKVSNYSTAEGAAAKVETLDVSGATFTGNTSEIAGGAIGQTMITAYNASQSRPYSQGMTININDGTNFTKNQAGAEGGAISSDAILNVTGATFVSNETTGTDIGSSYVDTNEGGGAIFMYDDSVATIKDSKFTKNVSGTFGGAISNRGISNGNSGQNSKLNVASSTFTGNSAVNGGAIATAVETEISDNKFTNNTASGKGGAIYNLNTASLSGTNNFVSNTASSEGGAVWNSGTLSLEGTNKFTGNKAGGKANDIHNDGTLNVAGTLELEGGMTGTGTTTVASGATMNIGTATVENKDITFESGSTLGLKINSKDEHGLIKVSGNFKNTGATLNPTIANSVYSDGLVVTLIEGSSINDEFNYSTENGLYTFEGVGDGTYKVTKKSSEEIAENLNATQNQVNALNALTDGTSADNEEFNETAEAISELAQSSDSSKLRQALEAVTAISSDEMPLVHQSQTETANQIFNAITARLAESAAGVGAKDGVASGDAENGSIWLKTLYNHAHMDRDSSRRISGFSSDSMGIAFGVEKALDNNVKAGFGYAFTDTDIDAHARDVYVDTHTVFAYGEYRPSAWYVNGVLSYNWSDYKEHKNILGKEYIAKYDVDTIGVQAMTGYDFVVDKYTLTPEAGLRYLHIDQDSTTDTLGTHISADEADILTAVIGAKVATSYDVYGYNVRPEARMAVTYDIHNDDATAAITLANGSTYNVTGRALKRLGGEIGLAVTTDINDNVELTAGYEGRMRKDYYDNSGMLKLKYNF